MPTAPRPGRPRERQPGDQRSAHHFGQDQPPGGVRGKGLQQHRKRQQRRGEHEPARRPLGPHRVVGVGPPVGLTGPRPSQPPLDQPQGQADCAQPEDGRRGQDRLSLAQDALKSAFVRQGLGEALTRRSAPNGVAPHLRWDGHAQPGEHGRRQVLVRNETRDVRRARSQGSTADRSARRRDRGEHQSAVRVRGWWVGRDHDDHVALEVEFALQEPEIRAQAHQRRGARCAESPGQGAAGRVERVQPGGLGLFQVVHARGVSPVHDDEARR